MSEYEGWSNKATWHVNLWISNEEPLYRQWTRQARLALAHAEIEAGEEHDRARVIADATAALATAMEEELTSEAPELGANLWSDLLNSALASVDWYEIARCWIGEAAAELARKAQRSR